MLLATFLFHSYKIHKSSEYKNCNCFCETIPKDVLSGDWFNWLFKADVLVNSFKAYFVPYDHAQMAL